MGDKMAPEFLEIPGCAAEQSVDTIADFSQQIVPVHAVIVLGMPNHGLNRRASFEELTQLGREIAPASDIDRDRLRMIALPTKALIDKGCLGSDSCQALDLSQGRFQGHSIIRIVVDGIDPDNPAL